MRAAAAAKDKRKGRQQKRHENIPKLYIKKEPADKGKRYHKNSPRLSRGLVQVGNHTVTESLAFALADGQLGAANDDFCFGYRCDMLHVDEM